MNSVCYKITGFILPLNQGYLVKRYCYITLLAMIPALVVSSSRAATVTPADPMHAQQIVTQVCAACHAADGNSVLPANPKLASQIPEYLEKQLREYKSGVRKNPVMASMVAGLSDADMKALATYFSTKTAQPGAGKIPEAATLGKKLYQAGNAEKGVPACAACHNPKGLGIAKQFPRLSGQHADYTLAQLKSFRSAERSNDVNKVMQTIALKMTDSEMQAVAEYVAGLR